MAEEESESRNSIVEDKLVVFCQCGARAQKVLDTPHQYMCTRCGETFEHKVGKK
jgi:hypothetical protein